MPKKSSVKRHYQKAGRGRRSRQRTPNIPVLAEESSSSPVDAEAPSQDTAGQGVAPPAPPRAPVAPRSGVRRPSRKASTLANADYTYVVRDVRFIGVTSAIIVLVMVVLTFIIP